jgi:cobaltochelatase CobN
MARSRGLLGQDSDCAAIGAAYLAATSHVYGGAEGKAWRCLVPSAARVAAADLLLHGSDDPSRDLLEGAEDAAMSAASAARSVA